MMTMLFVLFMLVLLIILMSLLSRDTVVVCSVVVVNCVVWVVVVLRCYR